MRRIMPKIYARSLAGKEIVTMGGTVLGELENIILDPETGRLIDLLVKPDPEIDPWDVDLTQVTEKFLERIEAMGDRDLPARGRTLLYASILLR